MTDLSREQMADRITELEERLAAVEAERDLLRRQRDAVFGFCGPKPRFVSSKHIKGIFRHDPANNPPINETIPPEQLLGVLDGEGEEQPWV